MGIGAVRPWFRAVCQHVSLCFKFFQVPQAGSEGRSRMPTSGPRRRGVCRPGRCLIAEYCMATRLSISLWSCRLSCGQPLESDEHLR